MSSYYIKRNYNRSNRTFHVILQYTEKNNNVETNFPLKSQAYLTNNYKEAVTLTYTWNFKV